MQSVLFLLTVMGSLQVEQVVKPGASAYWVGELLQAWQAVLFVALLYEPAAQGVHVVEAKPAAYFPGAQAVQEASCSKKPGVQFRGGAHM
jgi:hypothetical protein